VQLRRQIRRVHRALAAAAAALGAVAVLAGTGAAAPVEPSLQRESLPGDAEVSYTVVDPLQVGVDAAVAGGAGSGQCFGNGARGDGCQATIAELVHSRGAALGFTANFSDGLHILGLAVIDHQQLTPADGRTTSLCVGDPPAPGQRPPLSIGKDADARRCRTVVSGERIVAAGVPAIEGLGDDGLRGHFWWSVEHFSRVERTLVGLRPDGTLLVAVATSARGGQRNGMTVPEAAAWLIAHGVRDAIALDGGHQADIYSAQHGSQVPLERGEPTMQMALLLGEVQPPPPAAAAPAPLPQPAPAATLPSTGAPSHRGDLAPVRVDGIDLDAAAGTNVLDVPVGGPARPETGLPGSAAVHLRDSLAGDGPADLDARLLAATRAGHHLPDLDIAPAAPALPETGVADPSAG
jgi:hypothetical protein